MRLLICLLLLIQPTSIYADPYICEKSATIDPPNDISKSWLYPNGYDGKGQAPRFAANQNCTWKFNVPQGMFAVMTISASTNETTLSVTDSNGDIRWMSTDVYQDPYYVLNPGFSVKLTAASSGTLGMEVVWSKVGAFNPKSHQVIPNDTPWVISSGAFDSGIVISSASRVSLVSLPPPPNFPLLKPYMRNTVVFDGPTINDKLIGNLWEIWDSGDQVVSTGKSLTLFSLVPNVQLNNYILLQDYDNVKQFSHYKGASCYSENACVVTIQAGATPGAAVRMSATPHFLEGIVLAPSLNLTVYNGAIQKSNQLVTYPYSRTYPSLPQKFTGRFTTYVVNDGASVIHLSPDNSDPDWTTVSDDRKGFLVSKNYGSSSIDQEISETFTGAVDSSFKISVRDSGLVGAAVMQITVVDGKNTVFDEKYTSNHLPNSPISANGTTLTIKYQTNGAETNGAYVDFEFDKPGSGSLTSISSSPVVPTEISTLPSSSSTLPVVTTVKSTTTVQTSTSTLPIITIGKSTNSVPAVTTERITTTAHRYTSTLSVVSTETTASSVPNDSSSTLSVVTSEATTNTAPVVTTKPATSSVASSTTKSVPVVDYSSTRVITSRPTTESVETTTKLSPSGFSILVLFSGLLFHRVV